MESRYARDRVNGKILGVCSGLARSIDYDPLFIRTVALLALVLLGPFTILAYLLTGWLAD
ncbi:MAG TPA: PspC domain-containing protein [Allosphingosinicella sp.]|jgi:phage shock protein C